jgi:hypothetical protein
MSTNHIQDLRIQAEKAWIKHFNECSDEGVWTKLNVSLEDIKAFEISWKLRYIEANLTKQEANQKKDTETQ